jgi:hypothetical protein
MEIQLPTRSLTLARAVQPLLRPHRLIVLRFKERRARKARAFDIRPAWRNLKVTILGFSSAACSHRALLLRQHAGRHHPLERFTRHTLEIASALTSLASSRAIVRQRLTQSTSEVAVSSLEATRSKQWRVMVAKAAPCRE